MMVYIMREVAVVRYKYFWSHLFVLFVSMECGILKSMLYSSVCMSTKIYTKGLKRGLFQSLVSA